MDLRRKLEILADAAKYDASCASRGCRAQGFARRQGRGFYRRRRCLPLLHADGRWISLLKVLPTNTCIYDCHYYINRRSSNVQRARFTPDEVV
jgi:predicted DNA-binding helix-hairpin-helix protein